MFHTGLTVLAFYDFLGKGKLSREEAKVWEGEKRERTDLSSVCALAV